MRRRSSVSSLVENNAELGLGLIPDRTSSNGPVGVGGLLSFMEVVHLAMGISVEEEPLVTSGIPLGEDHSDSNPCGAAVDGDGTNQACPFDVAIDG